MAKVSFREQVLRAREDAIVSSVNRLLAEKGFDLMTVDEVAAEAGVAKASMYRHYPGKEALAAAAMVRGARRCSGLCLRFARCVPDPPPRCPTAPRSAPTIPPSTTGCRRWSAAG